MWPAHAEHLAVEPMPKVGRRGVIPWDVLGPVLGGGWMKGAFIHSPHVAHETEREGGDSQHGAIPPPPRHVVQAWEAYVGPHRSLQPIRQIGTDGQRGALGVRDAGYGEGVTVPGA